MPESRIQHTDDNNRGPTVSVFKKIDAADVNVHPFQSFKQFIVTSGSATASMLPLQGVYTKTNNLPAIGSELTINDAKNVDSSLQSVTYFSIDHLFYKRKTEPYNTFGPNNLNFTKKHLFQTASIFSIPQLKIGEGIKHSSFIITASNNPVYGTAVYGTAIYGGSTLLIHSDRYGNLLNSAFPTESIVNNLTFYEGFNEFFDKNRIPYTYKNITFTDGITATDGVNKSIGLSANFNNNGYIKTDINGFYDRYNDYSISLFITASNNTTENDLIIAKASSSLDVQYPFKIELSGSNQIVFSVAGSTNLKTQVVSTSTITDWTHVVCQKSAKTLQLYINGILESSKVNAALQDVTSPFSQSAPYHNDSAIHIGGYKDSNYLSGKLDEIRIYNKSLTSTEVGYLGNRSETGSMLQTDNIGNVFNKQGLAVVSTPNYKFHDILTLPYTASYRSTKTIHELNILTRIDKGDFNMSSNLSLTKDDNESFKSFVSASDFSPYITTIGLYNDAGQLLAIGKPAQPIRKRPDVDLNFIVQIDLDKNITFKET